MHTQKTILIISGGIEAIIGIQKAKALGLHVVVSDGNPQAPGFEYADGYLVADTYSGGATYKAAKHYSETVQKIDGVIAMAADVPHTVSYVASHLGLPCNSLETALLSIDKVHMKQRLRRDGVPIPDFYEVTSLTQLNAILSSNSGPFILKPADSRGARGVIRLLPDVDPIWAFEEAIRHSPSKRLILEQFLSGPQISSESLVIDGTCYTFGLSDRNYQRIEEYAPFMIEDGGDLPPDQPADMIKKIKQLVQKTAQSLGAKTGVVKGDIVIHQGEPMIIEMATRLSGGHFSTIETPASTGIPFVENAIRLALGETIPEADLTPYYTPKAICQRYLFAKPGLVKKISGFEQWQTDQNLVHYELRVAENDTIRQTTDHTCRVGMVIAAGKDRQSAIHHAEQAIDRLKLDITS